MQAIVDHLLAWYAVPENGLLSVALIAFISATLLPMGSAPAVFGFVKLNPDQFWLTVCVATLANTLGGLTSFWLGLGAKKALADRRSTRYLTWLERFGPKMLLLAWLPVVGDPLCAVAGWLKLPFWPSAVDMPIGTFIRDVSFTGALLWIPDAWWMKFAAPFMTG